MVCSSRHFRMAVEWLPAVTCLQEKDPARSVPCAAWHPGMLHSRPVEGSIFKGLAPRAEILVDLSHGRSGERPDFLFTGSQSWLQKPSLMPLPNWVSGATQDVSAEKIPKRAVHGPARYQPRLACEVQLSRCPRSLMSLAWLSPMVVVFTRALSIRGLAKRQY